MSDQHPDLARLAARVPSRWADRVSAVLDPLVIVPFALLVVAVRATIRDGAGILPGVGWAVVAIVFCAGAPEAALAWTVRRGRASDRTLVVREQRHAPLLVAIASVAVGVGVLLVAGAPGPVTAFVVAILAGVAVMTALTRVVKASFHVGVLAAVLVVLALDGVPALVCLALTPLVPALGWARVRAGRHTLGQVVLGAVVSALVVGGVFALAR
ncbi:hypothetical protein [Agilicoccus flavus]|uniref:hypothetical protein n=1 Tax=Agilicoccus flavus TaxID=2775968 RepID=UPI001CF65317|nr:hypothetical protein [Agilicoccus flavus]